MTNAKLMLLRDERMNTIETMTVPVDKLAWIYVNANRDPGEKDENGAWKRQPAEPVPFEAMRTFNRRRNLAAKSEQFEPKRNYALLGAEANREAFEAWAGVRTKAEFIPRKVD